jgi:hypothetical protein
MRRHTIYPAIPGYLLLSFSIILALFGCSGSGNDEVIVDEIETGRLKECFLGYDTVNVGTSRGCAFGYYKLINGSYVVRISPKMKILFDSCQTIYLDSTEAPQWAELLIFKEGKATLANFCSDVNIINSEKPVMRLNGHKGVLIIEFNNEDRKSGRIQRATIMIKQMEFINPKSGEKIELRNELLWKIADQGVPG